jgi:hypothetical protein
MAKSKSKPADYEWSVSLKEGSKQAYVGRVMAPDKKTAKQVAKSELSIPENLWDRVAVQRV